jgi:ParB family chromosome partitioning protein
MSNLTIKAELIRAGNNDRKNFDKIALTELGQNISENGIIQPPLVRPIGNGEFEIVAGERRFRAMTEVLNWSEIPVVVREMSEELASEIMLAENIQREDLTPLEEANAFDSRMKKFGWTVSEMADRAKVSETKVKSRLDLLNLIDEAQRLVNANVLPLGFVPHLALLGSYSQVLALQWVNEQKNVPTVASFARFAGELLEKQNQSSLFDLSSIQMTAFDQKVADGENLTDVLPRQKDLPELTVKSGGMAKVLDSHIANLLDSGNHEAANVLMDFWSKAVEANYANMALADSVTARKLVEK